MKQAFGRVAQEVSFKAAILQVKEFVPGDPIFNFEQEREKWPILPISPLPVQNIGSPGIVQRSAKRLVRGCVKFLPALA